jgi:S1-C subfamily serine protease
MAPAKTSAGSKTTVPATTAPTTKTVPAGRSKAGEPTTRSTAIDAIASSTGPAKATKPGIQAGWLGFRTANDTSLLVVEVAPKSPADVAGLRPGDRIVFPARAPEAAAQLAKLNTPRVVGETYTFFVRRGDRTFAMSMVAALPPAGRLMPTRSTTILDTVADKARLLVTEMTRSTMSPTKAPPTRAESTVFDYQRQAYRRGTVDSLKPLPRPTITIDSTDGSARISFSVPEGQRDPVTNREMYVKLEAMLQENDVLLSKMTLGDRAVSGVEFAELNPDLSEYFYGATEGALVLRVAPSTLAASAGVRPGDIVEDVNGERVRTIADLRAAIRNATETITLGLRRKGTAVTVTLRK